MRIDKHLNLIVPIYGEEHDKAGPDGKPELDPKTGKPIKVQQIIAYVHATPLPAEIVERHFLILAQTFSAIFSQGLGVVAGPAMAMRMLKRVAITNDIWSGPDGVERTIVEEVRRLTMVAVPAAGGGWEGVPLAVAVDRSYLSAEDQTEVENAIVFFISVSATLSRAQRKPMIEAAADLWGARASSLTFSEFTASLKTSMPVANTGEKAHVPVEEQPASGPTISATVDGKPVSLPH